MRQHFPHLKIYARARNREHAYRLMEVGAQVIQRETLLSSQDIGRQVLEGLGFSAREAARMTQLYHDHDVKRLNDNFEMRHDQERMMRLAREWAVELEELFEQDAAEERAE